MANPLTVNLICTSGRDDAVISKRHDVSMVEMVSCCSKKIQDLSLKRQLCINAMWPGSCWIINLAEEKWLSYLPALALDIMLTNSQLTKNKPIRVHNFPPNQYISPASVRKTAGVEMPF